MDKLLDKLIKLVKDYDFDKEYLVEKLIETIELIEKERDENDQ